MAYQRTFLGGCKEAEKLQSDFGTAQNRWSRAAAKEHKQIKKNKEQYHRKCRAEIEEKYRPMKNMKKLKSIETGNW